MLPRVWPLQAPDGEGGDPGGGDGNPGGDDQPKADPRLDALENAVKTLAQGNAAVNDALGKLSQSMEQLASRESAPPKDEHNSADDVDLETMDRKEFASFITSQTKSVVEEALKPLGERFGQLDTKIDAHGLAGMIKDFTKDHPDFFEWKGEMREILKENPTLTPARAYALVRAEDSNKAVQLDKKYGLFREPKGKNGSELLSLFPNGGGSTTRGSTKLTPTQAAEKAWDEVMANINQ